MRTKTDDTKPVELYIPGQETPPERDLSQEDLILVIQGICDALTIEFKMLPIAVEISGNNTSVRYQRLPDGYKVVLGYKALMVPKHKLITRLAHELVHIQNDINYVVDTCGHGAYHTEAFVTQAAMCGLHCTWGKAYGFGNEVSMTKGLADRLSMSNMDEQILPLGTALLAKPAKKHPTKTGKAKIYKIICPDCQHTMFVQRDQIVTEDDWIKQETIEANKEAAETATASVEELLG